MRKQLVQSAVTSVDVQATYQLNALQTLTPIRNRATLAGNIVNASPIGDLIIFLLALDTTLTLNNGQKRRTLALKEFFKGYKERNKKENELVGWISFPKPEKDTLFNFEKVSKRTHLDIASVNTGIQIQIKGKKIGQIHLSAGGVGPVPLYLSRTANYLTGKEITCDHICRAASIAQTELYDNASLNKNFLLTILSNLGRKPESEAPKNKNLLHNTGGLFFCGAEGETRTPTGIHRLDPEPSASTSSATSARCSKEKD